MAKKETFHVRKPSLRTGGWVVVIAENRSPLAKEIDVIKCSSREAAFQCYRRIKKDIGKML